jgi:hypothetical protein
LSKNSIIPTFFSSFRRLFFYPSPIRLPQLIIIIITHKKEYETASVPQSERSKKKIAIEKVAFNPSPVHCMDACNFGRCELRATFDGAQLCRHTHTSYHYYYFTIIDVDLFLSLRMSMLMLRRNNASPGFGGQTTTTRSRNRNEIVRVCVCANGAEQKLFS